MNAIFPIAASGMRVAAMGMRVAAHNIAVQPVRPVAPRQVLTVQATPGGGATARVDTAEKAPDMAAERMAAKTYEVAFAANAVVIRRGNEMLGSLFDAFA
ncbi:hypothetical protein OK348_04190 [Flavobacterium sp. MXW15]|uniref:Flagellar basal-body/hook protein C-terminal domain-containing protein n=1 Tax=Xanthomonas chitinilytica TaxID=2989819 RepID=A0ABT3JZD8_9XANT|nr:hypothetical protein [Xanthomonas sp. H13-6]MCW4453989.1 hypothetical protein [Flavobacterium sp. MXW15]MCW4473843.1 hypothetical protein [Xanthomonas sp. H13-6]